MYTQSPAQVAHKIKRPATPATRGVMLQRACACGRHTTDQHGECTECRKKRTALQRQAVNQGGAEIAPPAAASRAFIEPRFMESRFNHDFSRTPIYPPVAGTLQTKWAINKPDDQYEQEADRIANQMLTTPTHHLVSNAPPRIQRFVGQPTGQTESAPTSVDQALASSGRPLAPVLRQDMEQRFGYDFSRVRVHTGAAAAQSARDVNAHAYTVGNHIIFGNGKYVPDVVAGRRLVVHELVHVVQQNQAGLAGNAGPRLKSGLSLQRQPCNKANDRIVTDPLQTVIPAIKCDPTPETLGTVRSIGGASALGVTRTSTGQQRIEFQELKGSRCKATVHELESLNFSSLMYTKPGTYDDGTEITPPGRACPAGRQIPRRLRIIGPMAQKLRDGEIEHCEDHKLAFALSQGKFNQAIRDLEGEYCAAGRTGAKICEPEFAQRFRDRTGVDFNQQTTISQCLHDKTKRRDDPATGWHSVISNDWFYAPDCSSVTYIPSPALMIHINKYPSATIVKGCGEPV